MPKDPESLGTGIGSLLADYIPLLPSGARRAGAARVMAARIGEDPSILVKHPLKTQLLAMGLGGAGAAILSSQGGKAQLAATVAPILLTQALRRRELKNIQEDYDQKKRKRLRELDEGKLFDAGLFGGSSRLGAVNAYETMRKRKYKGFGSLSEAGDAIQLAAGTINPAFYYGSIPIISGIDNNSADRLLRKKASNPVTTMAKYASPRFAKLFQSLSSASQSRIVESMAPNVTRSTSKTPLGAGSEGLVFPSVTGRRGDSVTKLFYDHPSALNLDQKASSGYRNAQRLLAEERANKVTSKGVDHILGDMTIKGRSDLMSKHPDLFPQVFGNHARGYTVERLSPIPLKDWHPRRSLIETLLRRPKKESPGDGSLVQRAVRGGQDMLVRGDRGKILVGDVNVDNVMRNGAGDYLIADFIPWAENLSKARGSTRSWYGKLLPVTREGGFRPLVVKKADFSHQRNNPSLPLYLAAALASSAGLAGAGYMAHREFGDTKPLPKEHWRQLIKSISGKNPVIFRGENIPGSAHFWKPRNELDALAYLRNAEGVGWKSLLSQIENKEGTMSPTTVRSNLLRRMLSDGVIAAGENAGAPIVAHEAGHAKIESTPGVLQALQRHVYPHSKWIAPLAGAGSMAAGLASGGTLKGALLGTGIGALSGIGTLVPEAGASWYAHKGLRGGPHNTDTKSDLISALSTYLAASVLPSAFAGAAGGYISGRRKKKEDEEQEKSAASVPHLKKLWKALSIARRMRRDGYYDLADRHMMGHVGSVYGAGKKMFFNDPAIRTLGVRPRQGSKTIQEMMKKLVEPETTSLKLPTPSTPAASQGVFDFMNKSSSVRGSLGRLKIYSPI